MKITIQMADTGTEISEAEMEQLTEALGHAMHQDNPAPKDFGRFRFVHVDKSAQQFNSKAGEVHVELEVVDANLATF
jgi:hypothetical protein